MFSLPAALVALAITGAGTGTGQTVLLDFYSDSCGPCRMMMPTVDQLAAEGYPVQRVNVAQYPNLAQRLSVTNIPCFVMLVNGREAGRVVGATSFGRLEQLCSLGRPAPASNTLWAMRRNSATPRLREGTVASVPTAAPSAESANLPVVPVNRSNESGPFRQSVGNDAVSLRQPVSDATLLAASVRLRVEDAQGHSCGSGTIIDALPGGEALVLTCGHIFRDSQGRGKVEIDVFGPAPATHVLGRVISYDLERDVAFVAFRPTGAVTVARVAPRGYAIQPGDEVTSVGCDNGDDPTVQHSRVNGLDRFQDPVEQRLGYKIAEAHAPWNVEVAGQPTVGRSGGGLFSSDGMVIGVCNAAEPVDREGLFAALGSIHAALDQQRLTSLYQQTIAPPTVVAMTSDSRQSTGATDPFAAARSSAPPARASTDLSPPPAASTPAVVAGNVPSPSANGPAAFSNSELTALEEIRRNLREGSEVLCIIRDRNDPNARNQVIMLDRASPIFVNQLTRAAQPSTMRHETSLEVVNRRTPILEWDAAAGWIHQNPLPR